MSSQFYRWQGAVPVTRFPWPSAQTQEVFPFFLPAFCSLSPPGNPKKSTECHLKSELRSILLKYIGAYRLLQMQDTVSAECWLQLHFQRALQSCSKTQTKTFWSFTPLFRFPNESLSNPQFCLANTASFGDHFQKHLICINSADLFLVGEDERVLLSYVSLYSDNEALIPFKKEK